MSEFQEAAGLQPQQSVTFSHSTIRLKLARRRFACAQSHTCCVGMVLPLKSSLPCLIILRARFFLVMLDDGTCVRR